MGCLVPLGLVSSVSVSRNIVLRVRLIIFISSWKAAIKQIPQCQPNSIAPIDLEKCAIEINPLVAKLLSMSYLHRYERILVVKVMEKATIWKSSRSREEWNHDEQYSFKSQRSTDNLLSHLSQVRTNEVGKYGESRAVAVDISKSPDRIGHEGFLNNSPLYWLPSEQGQWIRNFSKVFYSATAPGGLQSR